MTLWDAFELSFLVACLYAIIRIAVPIRTQGPLWVDMAAITAFVFMVLLPQIEVMPG